MVGFILCTLGSNVYSLESGSDVIRGINLVALGISVITVSYNVGDYLARKSSTFNNGNWSLVFLEVFVSLCVISFIVTKLSPSLALMLGLLLVQLVSVSLHGVIDLLRRLLLRNLV
jgi:hypothetical protein